MLPLDDHRWHELRHVYGTAADVPDLRRRLAPSTGPMASYRPAWDRVRICHAICPLKLMPSTQRPGAELRSRGQPPLSPFSSLSALTDEGLRLQRRPFLRSRALPLAAAEFAGKGVAIAAASALRSSVRVKGFVVAVATLGSTRRHRQTWLGTANCSKPAVQKNIDGNAGAPLSI